MADTTPPVLILAAPNGLQILDAAPYSVDELGLTKAVVTYVAYPPDPHWRASMLGSAHPHYSGLQCAEIETRVEVFEFITCTYYGIIGPTRELQEVQDWYELYSPAKYEKNDQGLWQCTAPEKWLRRMKHTWRGVSWSQPGTRGINWTASGVQKGQVWIYTHEYTWSEPDPVPGAH